VWVIVDAWVAFYCIDHPSVDGDFSTRTLNFTLYYRDGFLFPITTIIFNKRKNKVSLCLTKYHTMKMYLLVNYTPHLEDIWRSRGIAPCILNLSIRWRWVVSCMPWPLYSQGKSPQKPLDSRLGRPQNWSGHSSEEKKFQQEETQG
jgi:hypothetical protein